MAVKKLTKKAPKKKVEKRKEKVLVEEDKPRGLGKKSNIIEEPLDSECPF